MHGSATHAAQDCSANVARTCLDFYGRLRSKHDADIQIHLWEKKRHSIQRMKTRKPLKHTRLFLCGATEVPAHLPIIRYAVSTLNVDGRHPRWEHSGASTVNNTSALKNIHTSEPEGRAGGFNLSPQFGGFGISKSCSTVNRSASPAARGFE